MVEGAAPVLASVAGSRRRRRGLPLSPIAAIAAVVLCLQIGAAAAASELAPYSPNQMLAGPRLAPPSAAHLMGTDQFGRDVLSRVLHGTALSLKMAALAVLIGIAIGVPLGLLAGTRADIAVGALVDLMLAFPGIILALVVVAILGSGLRNVQIAVGVSLIPAFVRIVRSAVLEVRPLQYIESARAIGCRPLRIGLAHILPNVVVPILVLSSTVYGVALVSATAINFLGLGVQPPIAELGADLANSRSYLQVAWWVGVFPGLSMMLSILAVNLLADEFQRHVRR